MSRDTSCLLVNGDEDRTGRTTRIKAAAASCLTLSMFFFFSQIRAICSMRWHPRLIRWPYIGLFFFPDSFRENKHRNKHTICSLFLCLLLPLKIFFPLSLSSADDPISFVLFPMQRTCDTSWVPSTLVFFKRKRVTQVIDQGSKLLLKHWEKEPLKYKACLSSQKR